MTWSHYSSSMRATRGDSEWNCDSLGCPQRCQESKTLTLPFPLNINDEPSVKEILCNNWKQGLDMEQICQSHNTMSRRCVFYFPIWKMIPFYLILNKHLFSFICDHSMKALVMLPLCCLMSIKAGEHFQNYSYCHWSIKMMTRNVVCSTGRTP